MTSDPKQSAANSELVSPNGTALFRSLVGPSPGIQQVRKLIMQVAQRQSTVLIVGESGTGKEIVARTIHYHSGRTERGNFVAVNCASLDRDGFQRQFRAREGGEQLPSLVDRARGGTLFLDVVDEMSPEVQALLLRFLEQDSGGEGRD
ncbi:sigma 54-interacting transcriptional regulator, partial [Acinetobacter baumannii]|uniref:sigma 54-interacting transcriptional regulator n=1 Tax=Acinetobacter baumannii TaxID=470 RepID=UPI001C46AA0C|nr:sigma 54-interacting transcriptional regulator [Acinetobacter baumannii]